MQVSFDAGKGPKHNVFTTQSGATTDAAIDKYFASGNAEITINTALYLHIATGQHGCGTDSAAFRQPQGTGSGKEFTADAAIDGDVSTGNPHIVCDRCVHLDSAAR
jgi:hypothetical protein